jgi:hypothetical protein
MHYFLRISHGGERIEDDPESEGFADLGVALEAAAESARDLLIEMFREGRRADGVGSYVEITDDAGTVVARVELGDLLAGAFVKRRSKSRSVH